MAKRNYYRQDFKEAAVRLVTEEGYTLAKAAKHIGVDRTTLRSWVKNLAPKSPVATSMAELEAEIRKLRKENDRLRMEREILKKATAFFASQDP
jgi:transposase